MKARRTFIGMALLLLALAGLSAQAKTPTLGVALREAAEQFSASRALKGATLAILGISSPTSDLSDYMLDEFTANIVQQRELAVVTRANLDVIKKEMNFQLSGEVSDETMQQLGAKTGASAVISGTFKQLGTVYTLYIQAFDVTTAKILEVYRVNVAEDETLALLMKKVAVNASGKVTKNAYDYTAGERIGIGFQNMLFGLGSYRNKHWGDGLFMSVAEGVGLICILVAVTEEGEDEYDEYGMRTDTVYSYEGFDVLGLGLVATSWLYGFIRPCFYHKATAQLGANGAPDGLHVAFVPAANGSLATRLSYRLSF